MNEIGRKANERHYLPEQPDLMRSLRELFILAKRIEKRISRLEDIPLSVTELNLKPLESLPGTGYPFLGSSLIRILESLHTVLQSLDARVSRIEDLPE